MASSLVLLVLLCLGAVLVLHRSAVSVLGASAVYVDSPASLQAAIDSNSRALNVYDPNYPGQIQTATAALFGHSFFRKAYTGYLIWAGFGLMSDGKTNASWGCIENQPQSYFLPNTNPQWAALIQDSGPPIDVILMIMRGGNSSWSSSFTCSFDMKVYAAQQSKGNVIAVIVIDPNSYEYPLVYMRDTEWGSLITIPSFFISGEYAQALLTQAEKDIDASLGIEITYEFYLPNPDGRVEVDWFYNVADPSAILFMTQFGSVARALGNQMLITPYTYVFHPPIRTCPNPQSCSDHCLTSADYSTLYCSTDSPSSSTLGFIPGKYIVQESIRQLCLYQQLNSSNSENTIWIWRYWENFYGNNIQSTDWSDTQLTYVQAVFNQLRFLGMTQTSFAAVQQCYEQQIASTQSPSSIPILEAVIATWNLLGPLYPPALYVNMHQYYGTESCLSLTRDTCGMIDSICYGYAANEVPAACNYPPNCPFGSESCNQNIDNSTTGITAGAVVGIVIAFLIIAGFASWLYIRHYRAQIYSDVDALLAQYLPNSDSGSTHGIQSNRAVRQKQQERLIHDIDAEDSHLERNL